MVLTALQAHYIYFIEVTGSPPVLILQSALSSITPNILTAIIFFAFLVGSSEGSDPRAGSPQAQILTGRTVQKLKPGLDAVQSVDTV